METLLTIVVIVLAIYVVGMFIRGHIMYNWQERQNTPKKRK